MDMIQNISVLGAGTMGHGIASVFAMHGYRVNLYESFDKVREGVMQQIWSELQFMVEEGYIPGTKVEETLSNITIYRELGPAVEHADYVIEAVPENMQLKQNLFQQLDNLCPKHTIFASNTSSLPLHEMTALLSEERKTRTMVCHWYNPQGRKTACQGPQGYPGTHCKPNAPRSGAGGVLAHRDGGGFPRGH